MWKGRFDKDTAEVMLQFSQSLDCDWELAEWDIIGSIAHAVMLNKIGVIDDDELSSIKSGLISIKDEISSGEYTPKIELEDVHMNIESRLTEKLGATGAKLHTGRSRNDQIATTLRLYMKEQLTEIKNKMADMLECLLERAEAHYSVIVPGYTHLQQAQPITMGHYWLAHFEAFCRDLSRLMAAFDSANECPLGAGALAGSTLPLDRELVSEMLGFAAPTSNSLDTVASRDYIADYHHFAALFSIHVSRLAEDFVIYSSQEFGWLVLSSAFCTGSSMMPQKKNPDAAELLRGKTGQIIGHALDLLITMKGIPMTYDRDLQEDKRGLFASMNTVKLMLSVLIPLIAGAEINEKIAASSLEKGNGCALATDVAEYLVLKGVPFRDAHWKVGRLVRFCMDNDKALSGLTIDEWREHIPEVGEDIFGRMSLEASVNGRKTTGGTCPELVLSQVSRSRAKLEKLRNANPYDAKALKNKFFETGASLKNASVKEKVNVDLKSKKGKIPVCENISLFETQTGEFFTGYFDGASRGNPGPAGAGAWISDGKSAIWENSDALGEKTNNEAEYIALINLLNEFHKRGIKKAIIRGDSKLVIEQMSGRWKVKEPRLMELCKQAKLLVQGMQLTYEWIPRERNSYADGLSNKAIEKRGQL
ncbi:MAG: argininosuccinate lyase [Synergistaceae bacterium]|nr:argininosuccinate lyase [Synergistaceae bacterium]